MNASDYQERLKNIKQSILENKKVIIWVNETPDDLGHILNPHAVLEDAKMLDYVFGYSPTQKRMILTAVDKIVKIEITNLTFRKINNWDTKIDSTKFKISKP